MLTPEYLASFSSRYLGMVDNLNEQIVRDIARRMIKTGKVTDTAKWQIKQAQESGKLLDDIVAEVGRFTGYSDKHVKELFKEAGVTGIRNDAKPLIDAGIINDAKLSKNMSDLLLANAKKTSGDINNLTMTTAAKSQQLYMASEYGGDSNKRFGDAVHTGTRANGTRGFVSLGNLWAGSVAGLRIANLNYWLGSGGWYFSARPSLTGRRGSVVDWASSMGVNLAA